MLIDTCALIWLVLGARMAPGAVTAINRAAATGSLFISTISAWEVGLLGRGRPGRHPTLDALPDTKTWFNRAVHTTRAREARLTAAMAADAASLPGTPPADPCDRMILSTARHLNIPVITRDGRMLDYAAAGHVKLIGC